MDAVRDLPADASDEQVEDALASVRGELLNAGADEAAVQTQVRNLPDGRGYVVSASDSPPPEP